MVDGCQSVSQSYLSVTQAIFDGPETLPFSETLWQSLRKKSQESLRTINNRKMNLSSSVGQLVEQSSN